MNRCPTCGAACGESDLFCEVDGTRLRSAPPGEPGGEGSAHGRPTSKPAGPLCTSCGSVGSDDGDGYCGVCGHRLTVTLTGHPGLRSLVDPALSPGGTLDGYLLGEIEGDRARGKAAGGAGEEVEIVLGDVTALLREAEALEALAGTAGFPRVVERGLRRRAGGAPFLALSPPPPLAVPMPEAARAGSAGRVLEIVEALLGLAGAVERAGYTWAPAPHDLLVLPDGALLVARLRDATPLGAGARLDAKELLESLAEAFVPEPAVFGAPALVRLLVPHREASSPGKRTLQACLAELATAREPGPSQDHPGLGVECDPGLWRPYNQDATAVAHGDNRGEPWVILVVCDGVSSSAHAEEASSRAAQTARDALAHFARSPDLAHETTTSAVDAAIRAAHLAVCADNAARAGTGDLPGTTIVAALVYKGRVTVGWVGDSRVYWIGAGAAELLTRDHSWVNEALARGEITDEKEVTGALAHTITRCLGPLEVGALPAEIEPDVRLRELPGPGLVLLCSDGLWNYLEDPAELLRLARSAGPGARPPAIARALLNYALARGGQDNVSVALYAHTPGA